MRTPFPELARHLISSGVFLLVFLALAPGKLLSQSAASGTIEGRVLNTATGRYVNNARVSVAGTTIETRTNENGAFYLANVLAGTPSEAGARVGPLDIALDHAASGNTVHVVVRAYDLKFWRDDAHGVATVRRVHPLGDRVKVELSPYDLTRGRITFRHR